MLGKASGWGFGKRVMQPLFVVGLGFEGVLPSSRLHSVFHDGSGLLRDWTAVYEGLPVTPIVAHAWRASFCC